MKIFFHFKLQSLSKEQKGEEQQKNLVPCFPNACFKSAFQAQPGNFSLLRRRFRQCRQV